MNPKRKTVLKIFKILFVLTIFIAIISSGIYLAFFRNSNTADQPAPESKPIEIIPLVIDIPVRNVTTNSSIYSVAVKSNKEITVESESLMQLFISKSNDTNFWYALEISNIGVGQSVKNFVLKDKDGNKQDFQISFNREEIVLPFGLKEIMPWPNASYTSNGDSLTAKVSKNYRLTSDYYPTDLKDLNVDYQLYTNIPNIQLRKEAADALKAMLNALYKDTGKNIIIASAFRPFDVQYRVYVSWVRELGQDEADRISARPGFSEHQLGTVVDFMSADSGYEFTNAFGNTVAGQWLANNAYRYGYVQSYPEGREQVTGYNHEAWHYRYVGVDAATAVRNSGLTLIEWLNTQ